jgi:hypothetical protein
MQVAGMQINSSGAPTPEICTLQPAFSFTADCSLPANHWPLAAR